MDGQQFQQLSGSQLTQDIWNALAHSSLYFILNVAVGGTWVSCFCFLLKSANRSLLTNHKSLGIPIQIP